MLGLWALFLFMIPIGISLIEVELGIQRIPPQTPLALIAFPLFSALSLWAALTLALAGQGTPLAVDGPQRLVTRGPYAFVRHPIALATIGQGAAVGLAFGSVPVLLYVATLGVFWYFVVKRREERALRERYGKAWDAYTKSVRALIPRLPP